MAEVVIWRGTATLVQDGKETPIRAKLLSASEPAHMGSVGSLPTYPMWFDAKLPDVAFGPRIGEARIRIPSRGPIAVRILKIGSPGVDGSCVISADVVDPRRLQQPPG
jgi:hypothetical protein